MGAVAAAGAAAAADMASANGTAQTNVAPPWGISRQTRDLQWWGQVPWEALHHRVRTVPTVPPQLHAEIAARRGALADAVLTNAGSPLEDAAWKALVFADRLLFHAARPQRSGTRGQAERLSTAIARRIAALWRGDWATLWVASAEAVVTTAGRAGEDAQLRHDIKQIEAALHDEDMRDVLRTVDGKVALASDAKARGLLPGLFPAASGAATFDGAADPTDADMDRFRAEVRRAFCHSPRRRGPGPGGGRSEYWSWLPAHAEQWDKMRGVLRSMALGNFPRAALGAIMSARVLALDREEDDKVRPLALGIFLRRAVSKATARVFRGRVAEALKGSEYSLGAGRGAEVMHRTVLLDLDSRPDAVKVSFDVSNAHNEFDRGCAWRAIQELVPAMAAWAWAPLVATPTHVHVGEGGHETRLRKDRGATRAMP